MSNDVRMWAVLYDRYGPPEVLYVGEVPKPVAGPGQVLVRVASSSVNGGELYGRAGRVRLVTGFGGFPHRVGVDFAGEVAAVGRNVPDFAPGDRVWGLLPADSAPPRSSSPYPRDGWPPPLPASTWPRLRPCPWPAQR
ncbi:NADPH:quinone reductase-like Zn-dependent oxidoreductase [Saccharothrix tamanrassetensis]|uniref:NADPH:quinone reductase-like Zn-dependent oxidoreductase n=1 Tax=Saccharothrix tamanrassetensis TaxID=1051531 RepID=A0A841CTN2_9PSEU|nr:alcohol dehydrogenase catalytic domain-containing protein [Saccharothrix tamanrassetensis]MBB5960660.1 NADPH:quinone reductase-like Zn-dependent oxidoreductase [Saccharothrix tamanrassetensis]